MRNAATVRQDRRRISARLEAMGAFQWIDTRLRSRENHGRAGPPLQAFGYEANEWSVATVVQ